MASIAQSLPASSARFAWLWQWLKDELSPYPGRTLLVARMVTAATLVMIISMTYRLPYGAYGALFALDVSRESLGVTRSAVRAIVIGFLLAGAYVLAGAMLVIGDPLLRFIWIVATLFLVFYGSSASGHHAGWMRFGYMAVITIPLWDQHITAQARVNGLLWAVGMLTMSSVVALVLEIGYAALRRGDDLLDPLAERLACVEELLRSYSGGRPIEAVTRSDVTRFAMLGTSRLRGLLHGSAKDAQYVQQMGALVALIGRLVDLAANLPQLVERVSDADRERIAGLANRVAALRHDLKNGLVPGMAESVDEIAAWSGLPLLAEIERTALMIPKVFSGSTSLKIFDAASQQNSGSQSAFAPFREFKRDHLQFGLKGCLAASLCYILYSALFWPEISTSITTCYLTALSTIGSSRQKQFLRIGGAVLGGFVMGMGAQVFILPYVDSIAGFTVLFLVVAGVAGWIITSSPRLSYLGVQVAFAFFLINLNEFRIQTSLSVARDRVVGILLGSSVMWLVFDRLWSAPAGVEMRKAFVATLRLLAQLAREPVSTDLNVAIERSYSLRETINTQFDNVRSLADGVLFEFGPSRSRDLELRSYIRQWQPQLRTLFVMRIASLKYRLQLPGFELPERVRLRHQVYDDHSAWLLEQMADCIEHEASEPEDSVERSQELLKATVEGIEDEESTQLPAACIQSFVALLRAIDGLTTSLASEVAAEFGRSPAAPQPGVISADKC